MFVLSQGAVRAIGVGANPFFLVSFLHCTCREHVSILPCRSLAGAGCRSLHQSLLPASSQSLRDAVPLPSHCLDGAALAAVNLQFMSIFTPL